MDAAFPEHTLISFLDCVVDRDQQLVFKAGQPVHLEPLAFSVLRYLIEHHHRVVTKQELLETCWQQKVVTEASITNEIRLIRKALGDSGKQQRLVRTVHGKGYQFVGDINSPEVTEPNPSALVQPHSNKLKPSVFGRSKDVDDILQRLSRLEPSFITLLGPGGMGKTTLAKGLHSAATPQFPDGIWFVDLLPAHDTRSVLERIIQTLKLESALTADALDSHRMAADIGRLLQGKRCLLILDNFEHVLDAAEIVNIIFKEGRISILTTSREPLLLTPEFCYDLNGLNCTTVQSELSDAAHLFVQRMRALVPDARLTDADVADINQICQTVGGMPLAIELAASWLRYIPLRELADEVHKSLRWLETDLRDIPQRHRSAAALFDGAWERLSDEEKYGLARLAQFPLGFTRNFSQSYGQLTLPQLAGLKRSGLVQLRANGLYTLHELIRQLALEKLHTDFDEVEAFTHFIDYLCTQGRVVMQQSNFSDYSHSSEAVQNLLIQTFERYAPYFVKHNKVQALVIFLSLSMNATQNARHKTRTLDQYLPVIKDHMPFDDYMSMMGEKLFFQIWQHHADLEAVLKPMFKLIEDLPEEELTYRARVSACISQLYKVNEHFEDAKEWAYFSLYCFENAELQPKKKSHSPLADFSCLIWTYNNVDKPEKALVYCDQALALARKSNPSGFWYGGFSFKAWTLANLKEKQASHYCSALLFHEALHRNNEEFLSIWTIQAAQIAEQLEDLEQACEFFSLSEYYLNEYQTNDLVESIRTVEVLSFMNRLENAVGTERYQKLTSQWQGQPADTINTEALSAFERACGQPVPTLDAVDYT